MSEKFSGGCPDGVLSLMAGKVGFGESFTDVRPKMGRLDERQKKALVLLVASDRIYGFFEDRGGVANGPRLLKLVRDLASGLGLDTGAGRDVSAAEARGYYDALIRLGVSELVGELGAKDVFCTVWEAISSHLTTDEERTPDEVLRDPAA